MTVIRVPLRLDNDKALRKCCPLCSREFKVVLTEEELKDSIQKMRESFLIEQEVVVDSEQEECAQEEKTCPYCGQRVPGWWTREQVAYFRVCPTYEIRLAYYRRLS